MPTEQPQRLDDVSKAAVKATQSLENRLASLAAQAEHIRLQLDAARDHVDRELEELDIEYSLATGSQYVVESPDGTELRAEQHHLIQQLIRATTLQRQLADFSAVVATSAKQLASGEALDGHDTVTEAAIRAASAEAQETERQRLAREIHDGPAQALANAVIALEFVERAIKAGGEGSTARALEEVERIKATLREGLTEIRRFIFDLRPTMLQDRGLTATIEHYVATYQSLFPMAVELEARRRLPRLSAEHELAAFRVIQEAIQNARKHARATNVSVEIGEEDGELRVVVSDNGRGFSPERVSTHLMGGAGLRGMRERAAFVSGSLRIDSAPGEGTRISLHIPLGGAESSSLVTGNSASTSNSEGPLEHEPASHEVGQSVSS